MTPYPEPDDRLSAYVDGELDRAERAEIERLLTQSPEWAAGLAEIARARDLVRRLPIREAPPGFWESLTAGDELASRRRARQSVAPARWAAVAVVAAAAVGVLAVPERDATRAVTGDTTAEAPALIDRPAVRQAGAATAPERGVPERVVDFLFDPFGW